MCFFLSFCRRSNGRCPIDHMPIVQIFRDKCVTATINNLQSFCVNRQYGCLWEGKFGEIKVMVIIVININVLSMCICNTCLGIVEFI